MEKDFIGLIIFLAIIVVLPIAIVLIVNHTNRTKYNKKFSFLEKCVENGIEINPELLDTKTKRKSSYKIMLLNRLMVGIIALMCGFGLVINGIGWMGFPLWISQKTGDLFLLLTILMFALGIGMLSWYYVGKKMLAEDIKAEEEQMKGNDQ